MYLLHSIQFFGRCILFCIHRTTRACPKEGASCVTFTNNTYTFCILGGFFLVIVDVLFYNIHYYSRAAFVESKTIYLRCIACFVTGFSRHHYAMPMDKPNLLIAVFAFRVMLFGRFIQISSKNMWGLSMYNLFLDMYRYVFWRQTFYSTPCPYSPKNRFGRCHCVVFGRPAFSLWRRRNLLSRNGTMKNEARPDHTSFDVKLPKSIYSELGDFCFLLHHTI